MTNRVDALARILSLAIAAFILMIAAISFPFLDLSAGGRGNSASVISTILAFSEANSLALAIAVAGFIILLPLLRLLAIIYAVGPLVFGLPRTPGALSAFRLSEQLRPWAMAEIFIVGVSIALVKVVGIASVQFGAAFWAFAALVVIIVWKDQIMCRYTVWQELDSA
jgi:paraquat-inducible protein A